MIGTPFFSKDEATQRKVDKLNKKPWEQTPTDEKGRKRFHGAFTGGFSAGHFNTCGSKEGWQPSNFLSKKDVKSKKQTIFDFMDEEDIKDQIGTHTIATKGNFVEFSSLVKEKNDNLHNIIPGEPPSELYLQFNNVIGHKLMMEAGFDQQQRIKKVYGCSKGNENISNDTNMYYKGKFEFKNNYFGVGYVPSVDELFSQKKKEEEAVNNNRIHMSKFNEDKDLSFYDNKDLSNFSYEEIGLDDDSTITNKAFDFKRKNDISKDNKHQTITFSKSSITLNIPQEVKKYEKPSIPESYDPFNRNKENFVNKVQTNIINYGKLNPEKRSNLISERFTSDSKKEEKETITENKNQFQQTEKYKFKINIPFLDDKAKLSRFAKYVSEKEGLFISEEYYANSNMMTASQIREEKILFAKLYDEEMKTKRAEEYIENEIKKEGNVMDQSIVEEKIEKLKEKLSKRDKCKWVPNKLLCKRFKVKDPYEHSISFEDINDKKKETNKSKFERGEDLNNSTGTIYGLNSIQKSVIKEEEKYTNSSFIKNQNNEKNTQIILNSTPNISLFDQIFGDEN